MITNIIRVSPKKEFKKYFYKISTTCYVSFPKGLRSCNKKGTIRTGNFVNMSLVNKLRLKIKCSQY